MALYNKSYAKTKHRSEPEYRASQLLNAFTVAQVTAENPDENTLRKVGEILDVDKDTSKAALVAYRQIMPNMTKNRQEWYKQNRLKIFNAIEDLAAESLIQKIKAGELSGKDLTSAIKTLHQLGRLEQGLSTENIAQSVRITNDTGKPLESLAIEPPSKK